MAKPYFSRILPFKMLLNSKLSLINKMSLPVLRRQTQQRHFVFYSHTALMCLLFLHTQ